MLRAGVRLLLLGLCCCSWLAAEDSHDAEFVTCGSVVKLLNTRHNVRLHSHDVKYGSGSGQQSVTGVEASDDVNSYWRIRGKIDGDCVRGEPIKCGQAIRLTHVNTGKNLHTHHFSSPLSNNQEVSAFGDDGEGDDLDAWIVQCSDTLWEREDSVRFKHVGTSVWKHYFTERVVDTWNSLPVEVVEAKTVIEFKQAWDRHKAILNKR
uniref:Stromal cell derived factor 2 like 1 n=1 Tax=Leptobrachium leishanense TaxID=445787 RepID=A0A8C5MP73_9ANUR